MRVWGSLVRGLLAAFVVLGAPPEAVRVAVAQVVDEVYPLAPPDGAVVGTRPRFAIGFKGTDLVKVLFKIELSRDGFETISHTFDWREDRNGWAHTPFDDVPGAIYVTRKPLPHGTYAWRVYAWNGVEWVRGKRVHTVMVDSVPPADVERLRVRVNRDRKSVILEWDPVAVDREGGPERVSLYHVYRYEKRSFFFVIRPFEIGTTEITRFEDTDPRAFDSHMLFYKVTAEDEAGNEAGRR